jgi:hypothetical protein
MTAGASAMGQAIRNSVIVCSRGFVHRVGTVWMRQPDFMRFCGRYIKLPLRTVIPLTCLL